MSTADKHLRIKQLLKYDKILTRLLAYENLKYRRVYLEEGHTDRFWKIYDIRSESGSSNIFYYNKYYDKSAAKEDIKRVIKHRKKQYSK